MIEHEELDTLESHGWRVERDEVRGVVVLTPPWVNEQEPE